MLKLKKLTLEGIGRFVETQTIDFTSLGNLVQVDGKNNNTGGSSGAGKSTVFNALDFLFGLNEVPNSSLQSRLTKETMTVVGEFDWDGKSVRIARSKKLAVEIDGEVVSGSNKLAEEKIDEVIGMSRDLFRKLLHKRQKEGGFFLQFTPKETHEFMADALGIGHVQKKVEIVDKKAKELADVVAKAKTNYFGATQGLESNASALAAIGTPPAREITQEMVIALKAKVDEALAVLEPVKQGHRLELAALELTRPQGTVKPYDYSLQNELSALSEGVRKELSGLVDRDSIRIAGVRQLMSDLSLQKVRDDTIAARGEKAMAEAVAIASEIQKIQASQCPTCAQHWADDASRAKMIAMIEKAKALGGEVMAGKEASVRSTAVASQLLFLKADLTPKDEGQAPLQARLVEISQQLQADKAKEQQWTASQNGINQAALQEYVAKQREILARHAAELEQVSGQVALCNRTFEIAVQKMQTYERDRQQYERVLTSLTAGKKQYEETMAKASAELQTAEVQLFLAEEAKRVLKSFASCAFDDALEEVGEMATRIVRAIPTMANATIQLEGTRETKDGKVKEEVNAVVSMDGEINIPIKTLSGGERSSVDLAIDLAVIDLLENKTNKGIDVFVLDEPFTGLDTVGIEMALEVLKSSNSTKRLVIVDHNPEVKQMVQSKLLVVRDGSTSKIVQS